MKRRALFVGVDEYDDPQIRNLRFSRIDAHSLNDLFADVGYDVKYLPNPTKAEVLAAVRERTAGLAAGDSFFFYFAGHGFTQGGRDLLFCRDDVYADLRFDDAGLKFDKLRQRTETGAGYDRVFVLDACRSDFLTGTRGDTTYARDLAPASNLVKDAPKTGTLAVLRSCSPYQYALEIESRQHGLFTCAFIDVMRAARREGTRLAFDESFGDAVAKTMTAIARNAHLTAEQTPDFAKSAGCAAQVLIEGRTAPRPTHIAVSSAPVPPRHEERPASKSAPHPVADVDMTEMFWMFARAKREREMIAKLPDEYRSAFAGDVRLFEDDLAAAEEARACSANAVAATLVAQALKTVDALKAKVEAERGKEPKPGDELTITLPGGVPMTFCWCPATTSEDWRRISGGKDYFLMGSPESEEKRRNDESQHRVTLTKGFWMGKYEVTQRQWEGVMGKNPSDFKGADRPVENVSWDDCREFVGKINAAGQVRVSLPTEAQWEYACRAGTTTPYNFGSSLNGDKANCYGNYPYGTTVWGRYCKETASVGSYAPNAWGLCDMHGNVWEWCQDGYGSYTGDATDPTGSASGTNRVLRGGSWFNPAQYCRSALRFRCVPHVRDGIIGLGFRLVCSAVPRS